MKAPLRPAESSQQCAAHIILGILTLVSVIAGCTAITNLTQSQAPAVGDYSSPDNVLLETFVSGADFPVAMVFLPDGNLVYVEKNTGKVRVVSPSGELQDKPFADFDVANAGDSGLLGVCLDPDFADNHFIYFSMNATAEHYDNPLLSDYTRVVRLTADGTTAQANSRVDILAIPGSPSPGHEGGNIHFGPDGKLYLSIGDRRFNNFPNQEAQQLDSFAGRMIRVEADGDIADGNPFPNNYTYAYGLRNSFDFTFDPISKLLFATENGPSGDDELNIIESGMNYGWPNVSGFADSDDEMAFAAATPNYRDPLVILGRAPTGIEVNMTDTYGAQYRNDLFIAEYVHGTVDRVVLSADRRSVESVNVFATGIPGGLNDLTFGPDGLIYISASDAIYRLVPQ